MNESLLLRRILQLLRAFCPDHLYEEISGDIAQRFEKDSRKLGVAKAKGRLIWNALRFFRPGIILRGQFSPGLTAIDSCQHFLKMFFRTSLKHASYTTINISGLALGLAAAVFILLWDLDELTFDQFHTDKDRIYQVMGNHTYPDNITTIGATSGRLGPALRELPEIESACRTQDFTLRMLFSCKDKAIYESGTYADASLFDIFTIPITSGSEKSPLPDINSVAISQTLAKKFFGDRDPVGEVFRIDNRIDAKVTAVFRDLPGNSTLQFEFVLPYALYAKTDQYNEEWGAWTGGRTYLKVRPGSDIATLNKKIDVLFTKPHIWPRWDTNVELFLYSINDWRLRDQFENGKQSGGKIFYVKAFGAIAIFILLIASFNFMNLATARSAVRSKEIGVRKMVGARRSSLAGQFMAESILTAFIALLTGLFLVYVLLPKFNEMTGKHLVLDFSNSILWFGLIGTAILTGIIAGSYPAIFLSSMKAIRVLKGTTDGLTGNGIRRTLVVFQFALSVILVISATVVYQQISYMRNKNLGFDRDHAFFLKMNDSLRKNFKEFKRLALANPQVRFVSRSDDNPMDIFGGLTLADNAWPGKTKQDNLVFRFLQGDADLLPALGFTFVDGRNFTESSADSANYIITEAAARAMRLQNPVGQYLNGPTKGNIIGVIKDFHSSGLQQPINPVIIGLNPSIARRLYISYAPGGLEKAMEHITKVHRQIAPEFPVEYKFIDEPFEDQYRNEILVGRLSNCFMVIAIFISCLGLFGLSSFAAARRSKEISVRKVLGASVLQMVIMLCRDFIWLIAIALVVGLPLAWLVMVRFLETFQFHIELGAFVFVTTIAIMLVITILTVSFQSLKVAMSNPVNALKNE
jgi:putative ABC transport system permease protein